MLEQFRLTSAACPWQCVHPDELRQVAVCSSETFEGGCCTCWLWLRLPVFAGLKPAPILSAKASQVMGGLVCGGLAGLHLLSQCKFFIPKVMLHSQYKENGVSEWIFVHENLYCLRECFSSALESVCVYSSTCLLDIPGYPAYEQVLGPVVNLGLGSVELLKKKKFFYKIGGRLSVRTVFN